MGSCQAGFSSNRAFVEHMQERIPEEKPCRRRKPYRVRFFISILLDIINCPAIIAIYRLMVETVPGTVLLKMPLYAPFFSFLFSGGRGLGSRKNGRPERFMCGR